MTPFRQIGEIEDGPLGRWIPAVVSLFAAGLTAILLCPLPVSRRLAPVEVMSWAAAYVFVQVSVTAATSWACFSVFRPSANVSVRTVILRFTGTGVWFAPLIITTVQKQFWAAAAAGLFAAAAARLLRWFERTALEPLTPEPDCDRPLDHELFAPHSEMPFRCRLRTVPAAISFQIGILAATAGSTSVASVFVGLGCFLVAWWWWTSTDSQGGQEVRTRLRPSRQAAASVLLATLLTAGTLVPYAERTRALAPGKEGQPNDREVQTRGSRSEDNLYSGVILLPEVKPYATLVAPSARRRNATPATLSQPLGVPFSGEYWVYYWPRRRPPTSSLMVRGTPVTYNFTSTDHNPLMMEARQNLGTPIDSRCCSRIEVAISIADTLPGTISVELILVDTTGRGSPAISLGDLQVPSVSTATVTESPARATLRFHLPPQRVIREFDEFRIVFHLSAPRMYRSANVAIDRFYLVPRGAQ